MRKWKKFLQNVEQRIKWWKLWKKGKDIGVLGDENETRWGELLTKETEEKFTVLKSFESLIIKVLTKCFEGIEMDLYLESYPGKFVDSKDKQKSHNSQDAKKERKKEREKKNQERMRLVLDFPCNTLHFKTMGLITLTDFLYERNKKTSGQEKN